MQSPISYIQQHKQRFIDELVELLKIPSISADTAYKKERFRQSRNLRNPCYIILYV